MQDLQQLVPRGWSFALGYVHDYRGYVARAWRPREKPYKTPEGVTLFNHAVSAVADNPDAAAVECVRQAHERDEGDKQLSDHEKRYVSHVSSWRPTRKAPTQ